jgi:hypothetical protein
MQSGSQICHNHGARSQTRARHAQAQAVAHRAIVSRSDSMPARHYYNRRQRNLRGRNATLELVVTVVVMALLIVVLLVFLFVYHDFPFRVGGP